MFTISDARVDRREHRQVAADPLTHLVHGPGRHADLTLAEELDDPVTQVLAIQEQEQDQDQDEAPHPEEPEGGADGPPEAFLKRRLATTRTSFTSSRSTGGLSRLLATSATTWEALANADSPIGLKRLTFRRMFVS